MARQPFVIGQCFELVLAHILQIIEVHIIRPGTRAVRRGALVERLARAFFTKGLDRFDRQRIAGQRGEEFGEPGFHRRELRIDIGEIGLARVVIEATIGAGVFEEILQAALEPDLRHDLAHFAVNPVDFAQADIVDLIGGEPGGGVAGEQGVVIFLALVVAPDAVIGPGQRLLALHLAQQPAIGGHRRIGPRRRAIGLEPVLARRIDLQPIDLVAEILEHRIGVTCVQQVLDIVDDIGIDPFGGQHLVAGARARLRGQLVDHRPDSANTLDIGGRMRRLGDSVDVDQEGGQLALRAVHLIEDVAEVAERKQRGGPIGLRQEQAIAERVLPFEICEVELLAQAARVILLQTFGADFGGIGDIAPSAVILVDDAAIGFRERRQFELRLIISFEECRQFGVFLRLVAVERIDHGIGDRIGGAIDIFGGNRGAGPQSERQGERGGGGEQEALGHESLLHSPPSMRSRAAIGNRIDRTHVIDRTHDIDRKHRAD